MRQNELIGILDGRRRVEASLEAPEGAGLKLFDWGRQADHCDGIGVAGRRSTEGQRMTATADMILLKGEADTLPHGWREYFGEHPGCQVLHRVHAEDAAELGALGDDILKNGLVYPVLVTRIDDLPVVVDGIRRLDAGEMQGLEWCRRDGTPRTAAELGLPHDPNHPEVIVFIEVADPLAFIISCNIQRRQLSKTECKAAAVEFMKLRPESSDRAVANVVQLAHTTIGRIRRKQVATGAMHQLDRRLGEDGKMRRQPCLKPTPALGGPTSIEVVPIAAVAALAAQPLVSAASLADITPSDVRYLLARIDDGKARLDALKAHLRLKLP
jgi:hypothetical protein